MTKVCVCQICTCGRHKCSHNPRTGLGFGQGPCTFSEYSQTYIQHPLEKRQNCKPVSQPVAGDGVIDDKTTHRVDYVPHAVEKRYVHQGDKYKPPEGDIDLSTSYAQEYTKKPLEQTKAIRRESQRPAQGKFGGEPTYAADYREWDVKPRERAGPNNDYTAPSVPFEGNSNYQSDYVPRKGAPRHSKKPAATPQTSDQPFDDATAYNQSYVKHAVAPREMREKPTWRPNEARLDDLSNYRQDYTAKEGSKQASCKPNAAPVASDQPFDGATTQRADYVGWQAERVRRHEPEKYRKPEGDIELNTTMQTDYTRKPLERVAMVRPQNNRGAQGKFDGTTNYQMEYRQWGPGERPQPAKKEPYSPNDAPFEGLATYKSDYVQHDGAPMRRSMKPVNAGYASNAPLDDDTEYKKQYTEKKADRCIVPLLDAENSSHGFAFHEEDDAGHKWYKLVDRVTAR